MAVALELPIIRGGSTTKHAACRACRPWLAEKNSYQDNPVRFDYRLREGGADLLPVLQAGCVWANKHLPDTWKTPKSFLDPRPINVPVRRRREKS
jgi:hypothetical protein